MSQCPDPENKIGFHKGQEDHNEKIPYQLDQSPVLPTYPAANKKRQAECMKQSPKAIYSMCNREKNRQLLTEGCVRASAFCQHPGLCHFLHLSLYLFHSFSLLCATSSVCVNPRVCFSPPTSPLPDTLCSSSPCSCLV